MKIKTVKRQLGLFLVNHFFASTGAFGAKRSLLRFAGFDIGEGTKVVGPFFCSAEVHIGNNCWIGKIFAATVTALSLSVIIAISVRK